MKTSAEQGPTIGEGIFTFPEASRIIHGATARELRNWMHTGLSDASYETAEGRDVLSFDDLVSLEVIRRFKAEGVSIQRVRKFDALLRREFPDRHRPFAYEMFFTDGSELWIAEFGDAEIGTQLTGSRRGQAVWNDAIRTFANEISFDAATRRAEKWFVSSSVEVNPEVQYGRPVIRGTRVPVSTVVANLKNGTPEQVADWLGLTVDEVKGASEYDAIGRLAA